MEKIKTGFEAAFVHSLYKIFSDEAPPDEAYIRQVRVLKNEPAHFQLSYRWQGYREWARLVIDAPKEITVHARSVENVPCAYPCHMLHDDGYLRTVPGLYPDLLKELRDGEIDLVAGFWRGIWFEARAKAPAAAGCHTVKVRIIRKNDDTVLWESSVEIRVIDASLPDLPIPHTEWFYADCLADYYHTEVFSERHWEIIASFMRTAKRRGVNMIYTPLFTPPLDTERGGERTTVQLVDVFYENDGWRFGFDRLERWIRLCRETGFQYLEMSHLFTQWGAEAAPKIEGTQDGGKKRLFGWDTLVADGAYPAFLSAFLPALTSFLEGRWDRDHIFFHISDEPEDEGHLELYERAYAAAAPFLEGYQIIDALSKRAFYKEGLMIPVCATNHIGEFLENRPEKLWSYYCTAQCLDVANRFIALPSVRNRIYGWQLYKYRIDGILHWGYNFYNAMLSRYPVDPYRTTDADGAFPSGDPFLVYPGEDGIPEESVRLLVMEETLNDLRALTLLEEKIGRKELEKNIDLSGLTFDSCMSAEALLALRERVNDLLAESGALRL